MTVLFTDELLDELIVFEGNLSCENFFPVSFGIGIQNTPILFYDLYFNALQAHVNFKRLSGNVFSDRSPFDRDKKGSPHDRTIHSLLPSPRRQWKISHRKRVEGPSENALCKWEKAFQDNATLSIRLISSVYKSDNKDFISTGKAEQI